MEKIEKVLRLTVVAVQLVLATLEIVELVLKLLS